MFDCDVYGSDAPLCHGVTRTHKERVHRCGSWYTGCFRSADAGRVAGKHSPAVRCCHRFLGHSVTLPVTCQAQVRLGRPRDVIQDVCFLHRGSSTGRGFHTAQFHEASVSAHTVRLNERTQCPSGRQCGSRFSKHFLNCCCPAEESRPVSCEINAIRIYST